MSKPIEKVDKSLIRSKEIEAATFFVILRYIISQLIEEIKSGLTYLSFFMLDSKSRKILCQVRRKGFLIIKNYEFLEDIDTINRNCDEAKEGVTDVLNLPGSIRFKRLEKFSSFFETFRKEAYFKKLNFFYTFRLSNAVTMLSETRAEDLKGRSISSDDFFADYPHFDLFKRQFKVAVALTNIKDINGPTEFIPYSSGYKTEVFRSYLSSWLSLKKIVIGGKPFLPENYYSKLKKKYGSELITMEKGDILIFDSRNFHRATHLSKGFRKILWLYY
jgi:hypothetical protein